MLLTCKTLITPTIKQEQVLWDLAERCRLLYNFSLFERKIIWEQEKDYPVKQREFITYQDQQNGLPGLKKKFPEYKRVYSKVLQMVLKTLDANFKSFFKLWKKGDTSARTPRYRGKDYFFTLKYNQSGFKLVDDSLTLSHKHPSGVELTFHLPHVVAGDLKQVDLYRDRSSGKWFVSLVFEVVAPEYHDNGLYLAIDPGIINLVAATNSQSKHVLIKNRRPDKYWRPKIAEVQSKRDRCIKFSRRWRRYNRKLLKMQSRQANQIRDYQHFISNRLVRNTKANTIVIGQPNVKAMASTGKNNGNGKINKKNTKAVATLHHSLQNTGSISRFAGYVTYKAEKAGKKVIRAGEDYTTQVCPECGYLEKRKLSERVIACCNCGYTNDRDLASSTNLLASFYIQKDTFAEKVDGLLHEPSVNEELFLLHWKGFLRQTANGKTKVALSNYWGRFGRLVGSPVL